MTDLKAAASYPSPPNLYSPPAFPSSSGSRHDKMSMSSSMSPPAQGSHASGSGVEKGPLGSMNLGFLKSLTEKKTRDGNPPKRRGPKPDSKPALTRRQELNRQAQRTHRERKELYIKALEDEVMRLKEVYSNTSQDKSKLAEENKHLKKLLVQNGIASPSAMDDTISNPSLGYTSSGSVSGHSYGHGSNTNTAYTPPLTSQSTVPSVSASSQVMGGQQLRNVTQQQQGQRGIDYDQAGIDFVLTLEKPCMDHMPWLLERANETGGEPCGHALMASCPPEPFPELTNEIPFGHSHVRGEVNNGQKTWELSKADLATLLDLCKKLDLDGEITPVMAWGLVLAHPRLAELKMDDFAKLSEDLKSKVRCYGFGAVMEEFEVRDALNNIFCTKPDVAMTY